MPSIIHDLLRSDAMLVVARLLLTSFFWVAGLVGLFKFATMVAVIRRHDFAHPRLVVVAMTVTELVGSFLLVTDLHALGWLGAGALGVFTLLSIPLGHPFWRFAPPKKMEEMQIALEHLAVTGGLMCAAILTV